MLAHHPVTGQPIRILKTAPNIYSDEKTLVWLQDGFAASQRWSRWHVAVSSPGAASVCGADNVDLVVLDSKAKAEDWKTIFPKIFEREETLFVAPSSVVTAFADAGLTCDRSFLTEDLYDSYPFLGEPLKANDELHKVIVAMAHVLRINRIAWTVRTDRDSLEFGLRAVIDAWASSCCNGAAPNFLTLPCDATDAIIPKTWLIQQYYLDSNHRRAREIKTCLEKNLACDYVDHILLLNEQAYELPESVKLQTVILGHRLRYYDVFAAIKEHVPAGDYVIFANSDIYFNETLHYLWKIPMQSSRLFLALLRWEDGGGEPHTIFGPRSDSQDAWMLARDCVDFELSEEEFGFPFGKPGCDNAISLIMMRKKFLIANPASSIQTIHLHSSQIRRYNPRDVLYRPHYLYIDPTAIQGFQVVTDMRGKKYAPADTIVTVWNKQRLGKSFPRAIFCNDPVKGTPILEILRHKAKDVFSFTDNNLWTPPPMAAPLYCINGGSFVSNNGLVSNFRSIYTGGHEAWARAWETAFQSTLMQSIHVPNMVALPFDAAWNKSLSAWILHYLPRALAVRASVMAGGATPPEFLVPSVDTIGAFLADCKWNGADARGNITVVPYLEDSTYYASTVWAVPPIDDHERVSSEDIEMLRGLLPVAPKYESKPIVVFVVEDKEDVVINRGWAESVAENIFHTGWTVRYLTDESMPAARRKALCDASWIIGSGVGLEWIWMAGAGAKVMEFTDVTSAREDIIHLAGACGLQYLLSPVKKEELVYQRQHALLAVAEVVQKYGYREIISLPDIAATAKPTVVLPTGSALTGIFHHAGDTFREMVEIWAERGLVSVVRSEDSPYCWWGGIGQILLYDRPTPRWWPAATPPSYQMALFGNCPPPGPGPHLLKQSLWCFWGRRPALLEGIAQRVETMRGYDSRPIKSLFIGKVENGVQHAARTGADWSKAVELFSMPIDSSGKAYPYSAEQYLEKLCMARFGLCLPGYGPKCNREIEYFCCGVVPIVTPGVDMKGYLVPPREGLHYFTASTPEEVQRIVDTTPPERWAAMSAACREWWRIYASAEGLFRLTQARVEQCRPYFNVGIPSKFLA
jgi:hypothetical protein